MEEIRQEEPGTQIIVLKQLPEIEQHLQTVQQQVLDRTKTAMALVCTEDTLQTVKATRAALNREFAFLEDQRKGIKDQILAPYREFEETYQQCISGPYQEADRALKRKIDEVQNGLKAQKEQQARSYYQERCAALDIDWLPCERTGIKVNMSTSLAAVKKQVVTLLDDVLKDIRMIDTMEDRDEILVEFKRTLDAAGAVKIVADRKEALRAQAQREAERREREARRIAHEEELRRAAEAQRMAEGEKKAKIQTGAPAVTAPVAAMPDPDLPKEDQPKAQESEPEPKQEEPPAPIIYKTSFTVLGTLEQLKGLKAYMEKEGIRYE